MENKIITNVAEHLERYLKEISFGWADHESLFKIKVVSFNNQPVNEIITYSTLGLSEFELALPGERKIRQELVMSVHNSFSGEEIASFMISCAELIAKRGRALLRGEVVNPSRPLVREATVDAVYVTNPTPFEEGFGEFLNVIPSVLFALLVPITQNENSLIVKEGWSWFEDNLESQDPDIWDLGRSDQIFKQ